MLLHKRSNQVFYFRWRLPKRVQNIVGKTELVRSLGTRNKHVAYSRASYCFEAVHKISIVLRMNKLTEEQVVSIIQSVWDRLQGTLRTPLTFDEVDAQNGADEWIDGLYDEVIVLHEMFNPRMQEFESNHRLWSDLLPAYGLNPDEYAAEDCERLHQELLRVRYEFFLDRIAQIKSFKNNPPSPLSTIIKRQSLTVGKLFSELFSEFIDYKIKVNNLSTKMQADYRRNYADIIDVLGDLPILEMSRTTLKDFILTEYRYLPRRNLKVYKGKSASELLQFENVPEDDLISDNTVSDIVKMLQGVFAYAVDRGLLETSPARDLKLGLDTSYPFGAYTKSQIRLMLEAAETEKDWKRWLPLIAAYTGARLGEIVQLRKSDVLRDEDSGRFYIRIVDEAGSVKTDAGNRRVPLHDELIKAGFTALVSQSTDVLFPQLRSSAVTNWFPLFRERLGIPNKDDMNFRLVFHSFRHSFVTNARSNGMFDPGLVQDVVGHEKVNVGITSRYTHQHSIQDLFRVVDAINYYG